MTIKGRILARYKASAKRLGLELKLYLEKGQSGLRYCSVCRKWKQRNKYHEYGHTVGYYSGTCKVCLGVRFASKRVDKALWGPAIVASEKLDMDISLYLEKRASGFRWCSDHKGWFDATELLLGNNPSITRCKECNRTRQREFRAMRKARQGVGEVNHEPNNEKN